MQSLTVPCRPEPARPVVRPVVCPVVRCAARRVDIVSGSFGAGHDAAAAAIADQLGAAGTDVRVHDIVDLMPAGLGRLVRSGYLRQVQSAPSTWRWLLGAIDRSDVAAGGVTRALDLTGRSLLEIAAERPAALVSTHPFASQALGRLRSLGSTEVPVTTYLTDMSVHRTWVHRGVDTHLAVHPIPAEQARRLGATSARVVRAAVGTRFVPVADAAWAAAQLRRSLGLPLGQRLALVTGGSCGIGRLGASAADIAATGLAAPVVLCGSNHGLRRRLERRGLSALGWVDDVPRLLSSVDVVVQNAGGITSLETAAVGVPMLTYRCIAGHGETNAAGLDRAGIAPWARRPADLAPVLRATLSAPRGRTVVGADGYDTQDSIADCLFPAAALTA